MAQHLENPHSGSDEENEQSKNGSDEKENDVERQHSQRRSRLSSAIETFQPVWFAICMNSGLLSILLHNLPYQFSGVPVLSTILYLLDLVLFIIFLTIMILKYTLFTRRALSATLANIEELCFFGTLPISFMTLTAQTGLTGSTASSWPDRIQHAFTILAYVMWWISTAWMLLTCWTVYYLLAKKRMSHAATMPVALFLPAVGTSTDALVGGLIVQYSSGISARMAVPVIVTGYLLNGYGLFIALMVYAAFLHGLMTNGFPAPAKLPGLMLLVGPAGQCGAALQILGTASSRNFGAYAKGTVLQSSTGAGLNSASVMFSLLLLGFDIFWAVFVTIALLEAAFKGQFKQFTLFWWSTIFPMGTMCTSFLLLGTEMDSPTFRVLATGLFLLLLVDYFVCWGFTIKGVWRGELLDGRSEEQKKD
ncbi:hypothetical protein K402DRAFT_390945 [Aulographum hederae CBS 113979]|uniref:C4-dicarboxylate transporter/malic acid transport protein n=1 Tax=Aulographum hederae CBS 113979 TaxID=1176131 RepID=A0A6G1H8T2_9PEZI|nr:hypothetical protein K402DRAFT_390945 [Aulographum hederae CBS 113979]